MWKFNIYSNKVKWGFVEQTDDGRSLKIIISPREVPMVREVVKGIQEKIVKLLDSEGFEVRRKYSKSN